MNTRYIKLRISKNFTVCESDRLHEFFEGHNYKYNSQQIKVTNVNFEHKA